MGFWLWQRLRAWISGFGFGSRIGWGAGLDGLGVIFRPSEGLVLVKAMAEV